MSEMREWTIMFYFACDNALAPLVVSLLKEIKDAGFQENTDVLVHFDPNEPGVPTRIYDVNRKRKRDPNLPNTMIGDGQDPFVRNMDEDDIVKMDSGDGPASKAIRKALNRSDATKAETALKNFLNFCHEEHRAKHYMLFLVGHGQVVGNDAFLPDDHPISAITLQKLGEILNAFTTDVENDKDAKGTFELLSLHSCSMSAIEVAYELKGTAKFLVASEGPSFVGSLPYRQLLKKIFHNLEEAKTDARQEAKKREANQNQAASNPDIDVPSLVDKLYNLTLHNATDFMLAGYSHDLALCSLDPQRFVDVTGSIQKLVPMLIEGLKASNSMDGSVATERGKRIKELVLLAHWEAQSYWEESYTDLFDFCRCLRERCDPNDAVAEACAEVMIYLDAIVIRSETFGTKLQYSHGLSIYFPWSKPIETVVKRSKRVKTDGVEKDEEEEKGILARYKDYRFTKNLAPNSWFDFLNVYFETTKRKRREVEDGKTGNSRPRAIEAARHSFNRFGPLAALSSGVTPLALLDKPGGFMDKPGGSVGAVCTCPSIKNYPDELEEEPKETPGKSIRNVDAFTITEGALEAF
jgi:hypothetical protein